ncbi:hypothetical protein E9232_001122 [Inquilinus ginsengisoli]|uniref:Uncharacterized protein n=1 Tax=Inquilinus ginsengisoli TaxID=363840 RepID=A0ABU1JM48_9PROT|nr:hypothetical protein [Inquilinus ginsengisoli]MDR6288615.1 hypothetical protein [Inquilinus ginsengisoli]
MTLRSLTIEQLHAERAAVEDQLNKAEFEIWDYRNKLDDSCFSLKWAVRRFRNELDNIEQEMEKRK